MMITSDEYAGGLSGYTVTDCVVRDRNRFTLVATKYLTDAEVQAEEQGLSDPGYRPKRVLPFMREDAPGDRLGWTNLLHWDLLRGGAAQIPDNQFVGVDLQRQVFATGGGISRRELDIPSERDGGPNRGGIRKLKTVDGHLYVCGGARSVGKRNGTDHWIAHTQAMPPHAEIGRGGFQDIDGFAEDDLYAAGGRADVWHYDGQHWAQIEIPTDTWTEAVCCAGDGHVYIAGLEGQLLKGRGDRWQEIHPGGISTGFRDMVWHEDRVWCANDYGLWVIHLDRLQRAELPAEIAVCAGHLYVGDGVLLAAGLGGAAFKENGRWHCIFLRAEMEAALRARAQRWTRNLSYVRQAVALRVAASSRCTASNWRAPRPLPQAMHRGRSPLPQ